MSEGSEGGVELDEVAEEFGDAGAALELEGSSGLGSADGSAARAAAVSSVTESARQARTGTSAARVLHRPPRKPSIRARAELGILRRLTALLSALSLLVAVLCGLIRPWYQSWGTREAERARILPGDDLGFPGRVETRAISIHSPAERVFAWVSQLGRDRAGFYSYELLEDLAGCEMPRLDRLEPALQRWSVGQKLWMYPPDKLHGQGYATLLEYEPGRALVFGTHPADAAAGALPNGTWAFIVEPEGARASRLIVRGRGAAAGSWLGTAFQRTVFEPLQFAMERRMLEGIQALAEGRSPPSRVADALLLCAWGISLGALIALGTLVLVGARPVRALIGFLTAAVLFQCLTFLQPHLLVTAALLAALLPFVPWTDGRSRPEPEVSQRVLSASSPRTPMQAVARR